MKKLFYILLLFPHFVISQISGVINIYTKVTDIDPACNKVTVSPNANGFSVGDIALLIQMQGATAVQTNGSTYGNLTSINDAGNYEFGEIAAIQTNDIYFKNTILNTYDPNGKVQIISVPQYTDVTIAGTLTADPWNGDTGGVLVFESSGTVTMNADMDVTEKGFRGASLNPAGGDCFTSSNNTYYYPSTSINAGRKGEGIAILPLNQESGRGKFVNAGGGGNSHNTGGGGGANYGTGGDGGKQAGNCTHNVFLGDPPAPFGYGGSALATYYTGSSSRIFLGGGGGGGHQNNLRTHEGGEGGGIVILKANAIDGMGYSINSYGESVPMFGADNGDGNGAGGAGGTILLSVSNFSSALNINAYGGTGGSTDNLGNPTSQKDFGPGGGGGGGVVWFSSASVPGTVSVNVTGGASGISQYSNTSYGATAGGNGATLTGLVLRESTSAFSQTCISLPVQVTNYSAKFANNKVALNWITANEKSNKEFIIEKSKDLQRFDFVTSVPGEENSSVTHLYAAYDYNPYEGDSYYRLSQKDMDGTVQVLKVAHVDSETSGKLIKKIYPQPFISELNIELNENAIADKSTISIFNTIGQSVFVIETNTSNISLPLSHLPRGIYFLTITSGENKETVKVVKAE